MDPEGVMRPKFKPGPAIDFVHPEKAAEHVSKDADFARMITNKFLVKHGYTGDNRANAPTVAQVLTGKNYDAEDKTWAAKEANGRLLSARVRDRYGQSPDGAHGRGGEGLREVGWQSLHQ